MFLVILIVGVRKYFYYCGHEQDARASEAKY